MGSTTDGPRRTGSGMYSAGSQSGEPSTATAPVLGAVVSYGASLAPPPSLPLAARPLLRAGDARLLLPSPPDLTCCAAPSSCCRPQPLPRATRAGRCPSAARACTSRSRPAEGGRSRRSCPSHSASASGAPRGGPAASRPPLPQAARPRPPAACAAGSRASHRGSSRAVRPDARCLCLARAARARASRFTLRA